MIDIDDKIMKDIDHDIIHELRRAGLGEIRAGIVAGVLWHLLFEKAQLKYEQVKRRVDKREYQRGHRDGMNSFKRVSGREQ